MAPTRNQFVADQYVRAEVTPAALRRLAVALRAHWTLPEGAIGMIGDIHHLSGYHRSRDFVLHSPWCTNPTYSVTETVGNRTGGAGNWVAAIDVQIPREQLLAACRRLDTAVREGRLEKITEWYGNLNGDQKVDGYDNIRNRVATSDPSHLWHLHISLDRGRVNEDHTDIYNTLTGTFPQVPAPPPNPPAPPAVPAPTPVTPVVIVPAPPPPPPTPDVADIAVALAALLRLYPNGPAIAAAVDGLLHRAPQG